MTVKSLIQSWGFHCLNATGICILCHFNLSLSLFICMPSVQSLELLEKNFTEGIKKKYITWKQSFHLSVSPTCPKAYGLDKKKKRNPYKVHSRKGRERLDPGHKGSCIWWVRYKRPNPKRKVLVISGLSVDSLTVNGQLHADWPDGLPLTSKGWNKISYTMTSYRLIMESYFSFSSDSRWYIHST